jgi:preprotein translocase subunit SecF
MRTHIPFIKYRVPFAFVSGAVVVASILLLVVKGLNFDTDFTGGRKLQYQFASPVTETEIRVALEKHGINDAIVRLYGEVGENRFSIKAGMIPPEQKGVVDPITIAVQESFGASQVTLQQEESVGPKAGKELRRKAQVAILVSCLLILIYIGFRFDFMFAPGAIVALIHDIIITLGAISLFYRSFSLTSVAALLTILGYSINDTIVLYDRIRENTSEELEEETEEIINKSINQVLSRTLITSITVLFVVVVLFVIAEGAIQDFAFAMIVGVIAGTYSSIFVASPVYLVVHRWWPKISHHLSGRKAGT